MKNDKISVILPVKNGNEEYLKRAVESVLTQSYDNYEILLIDDGSREEFSAVMKKIAGTDARIRYFRVESLGVSGARNFAVEKAAGDIITYLDGDDTLDRFCFEEAVTVLSSSKYDAVFGGTLYIYSDKNSDKNTDVSVDNSLGISGKERAFTAEELKSRTIKLTEKRKHKTHFESIAEPYRFEDGGYISRGIAGRFIRKNALIEGDYRFPEGIRIYEDAIWNIEMLSGLKICYLRSVWYYYFENEASVSNAFNENVISDIEKPIERLSELLDLDNKLEYHGYTRLVMDSLRYIYKCLYGHPDYCPGRVERRKILKHLHRDEPWKSIKSLKYIRYASGRDRQKAILFKLRLLFLFWKHKNGGV